MTTATAVSPSLDWLASRGLDASDLQALVFIASRRGGITPWAAFTRVLGLTESQAKTRAAHLERAELCVREVVEDPTRRGPKEVGSRYAVTALGHDLLDRLQRAWPEVVRVGPPGAVENGATRARLAVVKTPSAPAARDVGPTHPSTRQPLTLEQLRPGDRQRIGTFPFRLRNLVTSALRDARELEPREVEQLGLTPDQARDLKVMLDQIRSRAGEGASRTPNLVQTTVSVITLPKQDGAPAADVELVPAASLPEGVPRAKAAIVEASTYADMANLVLAEVSARASYAPLRSTPSRVQSALPQIVWACVHGSLTDYGPPLKRVRTALKLLAQGRWSVPKGMYPAFPGDFHRTVRLAA